MAFFELCLMAFEKLIYTGVSKNTLKNTSVVHELRNNPKQAKALRFA